MLRPEVDKWPLRITSISVWEALCDLICFDWEGLGICSIQPTMRINRKVEQTIWQGKNNPLFESIALFLFIFQVPHFVISVIEREEKSPYSSLDESSFDTFAQLLIRWYSWSWLFSFYCSSLVFRGWSQKQSSVPCFKMQCKCKAADIDYCFLASSFQISHSSCLWGLCDVSLPSCMFPDHERPFHPLENHHRNQRTSRSHYLVGKYSSNDLIVPLLMWL